VLLDVGEAESAYQVSVFSGVSRIEAPRCWFSTWSANSKTCSVTLPVNMKIVFAKINADERDGFHHGFLQK